MVIEKVTGSAPRWYLYDGLVSQNYYQKHGKASLGHFIQSVFKYCIKLGPKHRCPTGLYSPSYAVESHKNETLIYKKMAVKKTEVWLLRPECLTVQILVDRNKNLI